MDTYQLRSSRLCAQVGDLGAELLSLCSPDGEEQLWSGDSAVWGRRAPAIFPILGGWPKGYYLDEGRRYVMDKNGFARSAVFQTVCAEEDRVAFLLRENAETESQYPFAFELKIEYSIEETKLRIQFQVANTGDRPMPAGVGLHPGFCWDRGRDGAYLRLSQPQTLEAFHPDGRRYPFLWEENRIDLLDDMFRSGAITMENVRSEWIELCRPEKDWNVRVHHEGFAYVTIWSMNRPDAAFVCIEPATSAGTDGNTMWDRRGILRILPGQALTRELTLELTPKRSD